MTRMTRAEFDENYCAATTPKRKKEITLQYIASLEARNKELENKLLQAISIQTSFQNKNIRQGESKMIISGYETSRLKH